MLKIQKWIRITSERNLTLPLLCDKEKLGINLSLDNFWFVWLMRWDTWIRLSRITIIWDLVTLLCLVKPPPHLLNLQSFVRSCMAKNWFAMALTLSNSIDFYHDICTCTRTCCIIFGSQGFCKPIWVCSIYQMSASLYENLLFGN